MSIPIVRKEMRWLKRKKAYFQTESDGALTEEEHKELVSYVVIEYLVELIKFEAHRQGRRRSETAEQTARLPRGKQQPYGPITQQSKEALQHIPEVIQLESFGVY